MKNPFDEKILEEAYDWAQAKHKVALVTVIQTWGSSPRQVGSKMIVIYCTSIFFKYWGTYKYRKIFKFWR